MIFCMTVAEPDPDADAALEDCIARIAGGDKDALADLYNRTRPAVYGFALSIVKNAHDAEDILHDACLQVWNAAGGYRRQGKPMAWVLTITRNLAISRLREHGRTEPLVQEDWQDRLADNPAVTHEDRMMLEGIFEDGSKDVSLNDIVISRKGELRVIHFQLYVNGELLNSYEADGIIISTPTGSTAYNLSAGGPIVEPTASLIVITPICSHALNTSSIVLSSDDEIGIEIGMGRHESKEEVFTTFDGADTVVLTTGDKVTVRRSEASTKIMKLSKVSFLETLRRKMKGN